MTSRTLIVCRFAAIAAASLALVAATSPKALAPAAGGTWEISKSADGHGATRMCLTDPVVLAQWEQLDGRCTRVVISDVGNKAVVNYTCADGGFGRSELTLLTPRTLRVATQGISKHYPFNYVLHARRLGACQIR